MSNYIIKMPDIGEGIAQVELVAWHVKPGDNVTEDQVLADVMTDKATVEIPSPVVGKVVSLGGQVGQQIAVGAELIRLEVEGTGNARDDVPVHPREAHAARSAFSQSRACRRSFDRAASSGAGSSAPWPQPASAAAQAAL